MYNKAIVAFITPLIMGILLPLGITGDTTVMTAVEIIITALTTAAMVFMTRNKPKNE